MKIALNMASGRVIARYAIDAATTTPRVDLSRRTIPTRPTKGSANEIKTTADSTLVAYRKEYWGRMSTPAISRTGHASSQGARYFQFVRASKAIQLGIELSGRTGLVMPACRDTSKGAVGKARGVGAAAPMNC